MQVLTSKLVASPDDSHVITWGTAKQCLNP